MTAPEIEWVLLEENTWKASLETNGKEVHIVIAGEPSNKPQIKQISYSATLLVDGGYYAVPNTEYMKCFDVEECKRICEDYWDYFYKNSLIFAIPEMPRSAVFLSANQK